jgi:hypothetical protein
MDYARVPRDEGVAEAAHGEPEGGLAAGRSLGKRLRRVAVVALITALASLALAGLWHSRKALEEPLADADLGPANRRVAFLLRVKSITDAQAARLCSTLGTAARRGMDLHISYTIAFYSTMVDGTFATFRPAGADADRDIVLVLAQHCAGTIFAGAPRLGRGPRGRRRGSSRRTRMRWRRGARRGRARARGARCRASAPGARGRARAARSLPFATRTKGCPQSPARARR